MNCPHCGVPTQFAPTFRTFSFCQPCYDSLLPGIDILPPVDDGFGEPGAPDVCVDCYSTRPEPHGRDCPRNPQGGVPVTRNPRQFKTHGEAPQGEKPSMPLSVQSLLDDPSRSYWLKTALRDLMDRDPIDAYNDAACLHAVLKDWIRTL